MWTLFGQRKELVLITIIKLSHMTQVNVIKIKMAKSNLSWSDEKYKGVGEQASLSCECDVNEGENVMCTFSNVMA